MWYQYTWYVTLAAASAYVLHTGAAPEKIAVAVIAIGSFASTFAIGSGFRQVEPDLLAIDTIDQVALLWLMLRADRFWPIAVFGLHLLELFIAFSKAIAPAVSPGVYARAEQVIAYLLLLIICKGAHRHRERKLRLGADPSWSTSSA